MSALRAGEYLPPAEDSYDPAMDLKAHSSKHKKAPVEQESYLSKEQLQALRKVQHERIEVFFTVYFTNDWQDRANVFLRSGWEDEVIGDGCEAKYGCPYGWHCIRLSTYRTWTSFCICNPFLDSLANNFSCFFEYHSDYDSAYPQGNYLSRPVHVQHVGIYYLATDDQIDAQALL